MFRPIGDILNTKYGQMLETWRIRREEMFDMYKNGMSYNEIAKARGISVSRVQQIIRPMIEMTNKLNELQNPPTVS